MVIYLIEMFAVSLAITVVVELVVVYFLLRMPIAHMVWKSHVNAERRYRGVKSLVEATSSQSGVEQRVETTSSQSGVEPCVETTGSQSGVEQRVETTSSQSGVKSHVDVGSSHRRVDLADDVKGTRGKWDVTWWLLVALVNVLTNPPAVLLCWLGRMYLPPGMHFPVQITVEAAVVAVEAWVYKSFSEKPEWEIKNPVLLSIAANGCSWLIGMLLMMLRN